ncbi:MAG: hypothetical protein Q4B42_03745, partial [Oscillospiraceae bacterium]|nr:hypothetical protein [Oscillospiraceae bacterium]
VLPSVLFSEDGPALIQKIVTNKGEFLSGLYNKFCADGEDAYSERDFEVYPFFISEELAAVRIALPVPERPPLCHVLYILHSKDFSSTRYFTIERAADSERILGEWTPEQLHNDYGEVSAEYEQQLASIASVLMPDTPKS